MDARSERDKEDIAARREIKIERPVYVSFCERKLEADYESLRDGRYEDKLLYSSITRAIDDLKANNCGIKIPKRLWPKIYVRRYGITNLWKYDMPCGWRLIYTIKTDDVMILNIVLEWFDHKDYENRFKY